jgi:hypothetical protein
LADVDVPSRRDDLDVVEVEDLAGVLDRLDVV